MAVNPEALSSFFSFQYLPPPLEWTEKGLWRPDVPDEYDECPRTHRVGNGKEAAPLLQGVVKSQLDGYMPGEVGILLSSGMDSMTVAACLPKGCHAYHIVYAEGSNSEASLVEKTAAHFGLHLHIVTVSWADYEAHIDSLMAVKRSPCPPCEVSLYAACLQAKRDGVRVMFTGWGADTHFGGMDKLMSRDWTLEEFIARYSYLDPRRVLRDAPMAKVYKTFQRYITIGGKMDLMGFLTWNYHAMTLNSFLYVIRHAGLEVASPWGHLGLNHEVDFERVRSGDPKYVISEAFDLLCAGLEKSPKIPFQRPTAKYMAAHLHKEELEPSIFRDDVDLESLTPQQKWMVWVCNRFIRSLLLPGI